MYNSSSRPASQEYSRKFCRTLGADRKDEGSVRLINIVPCMQSILRKNISPLKLTHWHSGIPELQWTKIAGIDSAAVWKDA